MGFTHNQAEEAWARLEAVTAAEFVQRAHPPRATVDADPARDRWMKWSKLCVRGRAWGDGALDPG